MSIPKKAPVFFLWRWLLIWLPTLILVAGMLVYAIYDYNYIRKPFYERLEKENFSSPEIIDKQKSETPFGEKDTFGEHSVKIALDWRCDVATIAA